MKEEKVNSSVIQSETAREQYKCLPFEMRAPVTCFIAPVQSLCVNVITALLLLCCVFQAAPLQHKASQQI